MRFRDYVKSILGKSLEDYKRNKKYLTSLSFFCIVLIFIPVLLEDILMPRAAMLLILLPGWILLYLCVYSAFFAAKGAICSLNTCVPDKKTVVKSILVSFAGFCIFSLPLMVYFIRPPTSETSFSIMVIFLAASVFILLFSGWITFLCFYGVLDKKPFAEVFVSSFRYLRKNLFKLFALLFIVLLVFMFADMTIVGLFFVFPFILVVFANIYLQFYTADTGEKK